MYVPICFSLVQISLTNLDVNWLVELHTYLYQQHYSISLECFAFFQRPIDVLKIDIEEYEYLAVPNMLQTGILKDIRQMAIEFHVTLKPDRSRRYKEEPPRDKYFFALSLFKDLYDLGFRIFWTHRNPTCKFFSKKGNVERVTCHEVSFVNINNMWGVCYWFCQLQVCSSLVIKSLNGVSVPTFYDQRPIDPQLQCTGFVCTKVECTGFFLFSNSEQAFFAFFMPQFKFCFKPSLSHTVSL